MVPKWVEDKTMNNNLYIAIKWGHYLSRHFHLDETTLAILLYTNI